MTKTISDMTFEELQDYALELEHNITDLKAEHDSTVSELSTKLAEMQDLNHALQQRNNKLFTQLESGITPVQATPEPQPTCEEFATTLKGVFNK